MSGGGGEQTTNTTAQPWSGAVGTLNGALAQVNSAAGQKYNPFPGPLTVGPTSAENHAWQQQGLADANTYGNNNNPLNFQDASGALRSQLQGGGYNPLLNATGGAGAQVAGAFQNAQSPMIGNYGWNATIDPSGAAPQFGQAGSLDATGALRSALSGQPDYAGVQGAIDAANAPLLRDFQNNLLPSLNSRATFLNNGTGGYKALATALPDLGQRMSQNALQVTEGERQRALAAQQQAAGLVSAGGLQSYGLGLQQQLGQAGASQALAGQNLSTDIAGANAQSNYLQNMLGYGGFANNVAGGAANTTAQGLNAVPSIYAQGNTGLNNQFAQANYQRTLAEQNLAARQAQFSEQNNYARNNASWYANLAAQLGGLGGSTSSTSTAPQGGGALQGALGGAMAGSSFGPWGTLIGGAAGAILG